MEARIILVALFALFINTGSCDFSSHATIKNTEREEPAVNPLCPPEEDPKNPTVLPYPNDCSKFYKCLYGKAYPISCPQGLHFSAQLRRCDWPEVAACDPNVATPKTPKPSTSLPPTSPRPTIEPPKLNPLCPADDDPKNPTVLPDPVDCTKFFKCLNRIAYPVSCPAGLHWSTTLNRCDWPEVAKCDPNVKVTADKHDVKVPLKKEQVTTSEPITTIMPTSVTPPIHMDCPVIEDPNKTVFLPNPTDCSKFFKCVNRRGYPMECPSGLHFGVKLGRCEWPEVAGCDPNISTTPIPRTTPTPKRKTTQAPSVPLDCPPNEDPKNPTVLPYPGDCSKFYKCLSGRAYPIACPTGLHYSPKLGRCEWPEIAKCDPNIKVEPKPTVQPEIITTTPVSVSPTPQEPAEKLILPGNPAKTTKSCKTNSSHTKMIAPNSSSALEIKQ